MTKITNSVFKAFDKPIKQTAESILDKLISIIKNILTGAIDETKAGLSIQKSILEALITCKNSQENELILEYNIDGASNHKLSISKNGDKIVIGIIESTRFFPENIKIKTIKTTEIDKYWSTLKKAEIGQEKYQQIDKIVTELNYCFEKKSKREVYTDFVKNNSNTFNTYIGNLTQQEQNKIIKVVEHPESEAGQDELQPLADFYFKHNSRLKHLFNAVSSFAKCENYDSNSIQNMIKTYCFIANHTTNQKFDTENLPEKLSRMIIDCVSSLEE